MESSMPLSEYASKLEEHVKQRYLQKISSIGVDPALIEGKLTLRTRQPDCLPPVESIDLLFYLVLETSFYALPSAAYKPIIKWFQGLLRAYKVISLPTSLLFWPKCDTIVQYSLTFRALALRQREIRHRISGKSRVSIAIIHVEIFVKQSTMKWQNGMPNLETPMLKMFSLLNKLH